MQFALFRYTGLLPTKLACTCIFIQSENILVHKGGVSDSEVLITSELFIKKYSEEHILVSNTAFAHLKVTK